MRKTCSSGSEEGVMGNHDPYSDRPGLASRGRLGMTDRELGSVLP